MIIKTDSEFLLFAMSHYDNPRLTSPQEFESDIKRFTALNNLLNRYRFDKLDLKERLIVNHIIILGNCFTIPGVIKMINYKIQSENQEIINTFLYYLNIISDSDNTDKFLLDILNEK